jgi:hypothetical protein
MLKMSGTRRTNPSKNPASGTPGGARSNFAANGPMTTPKPLAARQKRSSGRLRVSEFDTSNKDS